MCYLLQAGPDTASPLGGPGRIPEPTLTLSAPEKTGAGRGRAGFCRVTRTSTPNLLCLHSQEEGLWLPRAMSVHLCAVCVCVCVCVRARARVPHVYACTARGQKSIGRTRLLLPRSRPTEGAVRQGFVLAPQQQTWLFPGTPGRGLRDPVGHQCTGPRAPRLRRKG